MPYDRGDSNMTDLQAFSPEYEGLFAQLHARIKKKESPTDEEILCLLKWKLGWINDVHFRTVHENGDRIRAALIEAGDQDVGGRKRAVHKLISIPQIAVSVASALLTACWPDYTVLDRRALKELKEAGCHTPPWPTDSARWAQDVDGFFDRYLPAVERFRQQEKLKSLREADRTLWGRSVRNEIREGLGLNWNSSRLPRN